MIIREATAGRERFRREGPAYRSGWEDGRFGQPQPFGANNNLAVWTEELDRLAYYRGHRAGRHVREMLGGDGKTA